MQFTPYQPANAGAAFMAGYNAQQDRARRQQSEALQEEFMRQKIDLAAAQEERLAAEQDWRQDTWQQDFTARETHNAWARGNADRAYNIAAAQENRQARAFEQAWKDAEKARERENLRWNAQENLATGNVPANVGVANWIASGGDPAALGALLQAGEGANAWRAAATNKQAQQAAQAAQMRAQARFYSRRIPHEGGAEAAGANAAQDARVAFAPQIQEQTARAANYKAAQDAWTPKPAVELAAANNGDYTLIYPTKGGNPEDFVGKHYMPGSAKGKGDDDKKSDSAILGKADFGDYTAESVEKAGGVDKAGLLLAEGNGGAQTWQTILQENARRNNPEVIKEIKDSYNALASSDLTRNSRSLSATYSAWIEQIKDIESLDGTAKESAIKHFVATLQTDKKLIASGGGFGNSVDPRWLGLTTDEEGNFVERFIDKSLQILQGEIQPEQVKSIKARLQNIRDALQRSARSLATQEAQAFITNLGAMDMGMSVDGEYRPYKSKTKTAIGNLIVDNLLFGDSLKRRRAAAGSSPATSFAPQVSVEAPAAVETGGGFAGAKAAADARAVADKTNDAVVGGDMTTDDFARQFNGGEGGMSKDNLSQYMQAQKQAAPLYDKAMDLLKAYGDADAAGKKSQQAALQNSMLQAALAYDGMALPDDLRKTAMGGNGAPTAAFYRDANNAMQFTAGGAAQMPASVGDAAELLAGLDDAPDQGQVAKYFAPDPAHKGRFAGAILSYEGRGKETAAGAPPDITENLVVVVPEAALRLARDVAKLRQQGDGVSEMRANDKVGAALKMMKMYGREGGLDILTALGGM